MCTPENAILTGSRVYGTPRKTSDIDLVVLMDEDTALVLQSMVEAFGGDDSQAEAYDESKGGKSYVFRFGALNLLVATDEEKFKIWKQGTDLLIGERPVTRDRAVAVFSALRNGQPIPGSPAAIAAEEPF